jgi:hypothetical protein
VERARDVIKNLSDKFDNEIGGVRVLRTYPKNIFEKFMRRTMTLKKLDRRRRLNVAG